MTLFRSACLFILLASSGSLWAASPAQCLVTGGVKCPPGNEFCPAAAADRIMKSYSDACLLVSDVGGLINAASNALSSQTGLVAKCITSNASNSVGQRTSEATTQAAGGLPYAVTATATVCMVPTPNGAPNQIFVCSAATGSGSASANIHVDCAPGRDPAKPTERTPVAAYGADATLANTAGLMNNRRTLKVRYSGITAGTSTESEFTMSLDALFAP